MNIKPIDLLQKATTSSLDTLLIMSGFETMGCLCTETLSVQLNKEWGECIRLENNCQQLDLSHPDTDSAYPENADVITQGFIIDSSFPATLQINRTIPAIMVDIACGGNGDVSVTNPKLTTSEQHMLARLINLLTHHYAQAFAAVTDRAEIGFIVTDNHPVSDSFRADQATPDINLLHTIRMMVGIHAYDIRFEIAQSHFHQLQNERPDDNSSTLDTRQLKSRLNTVPVSLTATLCEYTSSLREIKQLKAGDFIPIRMSSAARIHTSGRHLFDARVVKQNNQLCLQVLKTVNNAAQAEPELLG